MTLMDYSEPLTSVPLRVTEIEIIEDYTPHARLTDPESSHEAAEGSFGAPWLRQAVMTHTSRHQWQTADELIVLIFGPGPYTLQEAKALTHIQNAARQLWEEGLIQRRKLPAHNLQYRRGSHERL